MKRLSTALFLASAPLATLHAFDERLIVRCASSRPCDCSSTQTTSSSSSRSNRNNSNRLSRSRASVRANGSVSSSSLLVGRSSSSGGSRLADATLADQLDRILRLSCEEDGRQKNELLERRLLGIEEVTHDEDVDNNVDNDTEGKQVTEDSVAKDSASKEKISAALSSQNVVPATNNHPFPIMGSTAAVLALSAVALSIYLSGGLSAAATMVGSSGATLSSPAASSAIEKFHYFFRGGSVNYTAGRVSCALLALQRQLGIRTVTTYATTKAIPSAVRMLKKMIIMEVWRRVWILTFHQISRTTKRISRGTVHMYQRVVPLFIRRGLQSMFKSSVQRAVHGTVGQWTGMAVAGATDFVNGMLSTQFETVVTEAAEEVVESAVESVLEDVVEESCGGLADAVMDSVADAAAAAAS